VVAAGTRFVGDIELSDSIHLDGEMKGGINSEGDVAIGESGSFEGRISAKRVVISGCFQGELEADRLEIVASGRVSGEIHVGELVIESGGQFNGTSHIRDAQEPHRLTHQPLDDSAGQESSPRPTEIGEELADSVIAERKLG
jgi:cytoskeletal protein CcmA (bactofilin family)